MVAIPAVVAWSAPNNPQPFDSDPVLRQTWKGLARTRSVRVGPQKLPLTEMLVLAASHDFVATSELGPARTLSCRLRWLTCIPASSPAPRVREGLYADRLRPLAVVGRFGDPPFPEH